ncbi:TPA: hypothetical protein EYP66_20300, partial [Candidatus Poribacteria bacterium]|nr:hypothetical protein [Candidatus Poribacteria bacterium]
MDLVFQIIFTAMGAFLSVILTKFLIQNGKIIAENSKAIAKLDEKFDERTARIADFIAENNKTMAKLDE